MIAIAKEKFFVYSFFYAELGNSIEARHNVLNLEGRGFGLYEDCRSIDWAIVHTDIEQMVRETFHRQQVIGQSHCSNELRLWAIHTKGSSYWYCYTTDELLPEIDTQKLASFDNDDRQSRLAKYCTQCGAVMPRRGGKPCPRQSKMRNQ